MNYIKQHYTLLKMRIRKENHFFIYRKPEIQFSVHQNKTIILPLKNNYVLSNMLRNYQDKNYAHIFYALKYLIFIFS